MRFGSAQLKLSRQSAAPLSLPIIPSPEGRRGESPDFPQSKRAKNAQRLRQTFANRPYVLIIVLISFPAPPLLPFTPPRPHRAPLTDRTGARNHPRTSAAFANEPLQTSNERPLQIKNQGGHFWRKKAPNKQTLYLYRNKYKFFFFLNPTRQTNSEAKNIAQFPPPSRLFHRCCTPKIAPRKGGKIKGRKSPPLPHPPARRASIVYVLAVPICFYVRLSGPIARSP